MQTPSLRRRMACWLYEGMLLFGVVFIAGYLFGTLSQTHHAMQNRWGLQAFIFLVFGIYFTWFWHKGQTLAMKTWHILITQANGEVPTQKQALIRYVSSWIWFLPPLILSWFFHMNAILLSVSVMGWVVLWALLSRLHPTQQFWHDRWAGTQLIHQTIPKSHVESIKEIDEA
ncbi:MAG: RDD family protein [Betaproteobacteria bacterium]|nr:RDD family protein [Betaproteobacteria bacterium]